MKLRFIFLSLCAFGLIALQFSCRKDFSAAQSHGNLSFSTDTLFLDTVFTNLTTTTHQLKVYNHSEIDVSIPLIKLGKNDSKYRLNIDGSPGTEFTDVLVRENDSIFILIEATISAEETEEMLYEDQILFDPEGIEQSVQLVTLVQDAHLLFPEIGETEFDITQNILTNEKPYVIFGQANVPENTQLTIQAGSTLFFNQNASLHVSEGANLNIEGTRTDSIVFRGDNLNADFDEIAGQWKGISLINNANSSFNYLKILNATTAISVQNNTNVLSIKNTEIYNSGNIGIDAKNASIDAENLIIGDALKEGLNLQGGTYTFNHCTLANYWLKSFRNSSHVRLSNFYENPENSSQKISAPLHTAQFNNCIITGSTIVENEIEFEIDEDDTVFNFHFNHCMMDLEEGEDFLDLSNPQYYTNNIIHGFADFYDTRENDFRIGLNSEAIEQADATIANQIPLDIHEVDRTLLPDIGAYQHINFETLNTEDEE